MDFEIGISQFFDIEDNGPLPIVKWCVVIRREGMVLSEAIHEEMGVACSKALGLAIFNRAEEAEGHLAQIAEAKKEGIQ